MVGSQTGDIEFSCFNAALFASALFFSNASLPDVLKEVGTIINMMTARRQDSILVLVKPFFQMTQNLMGLCTDPLEIDAAFRHARDTSNVTSLLCLRLQKMMLSFLFGDDVGANRMLEELERGVAPPGIEKIFCVFFGSMTRLELARSARGFHRQILLRKVRRAIKEYKTWALNAPHNCLPMKFLLEAEFASVIGKNNRAYEKFTAASAVAAGSGFRMIEALAHERSARHLLSHGDEMLAAFAFKQAYSCYREWGAQAKVDHLAKEMESKFKVNAVYYGNGWTPVCMVKS